jgi:predicted RNA-binding Zn-ribbon protein involved in translation (DUF1610 family)
MHPSRFERWQEEIAGARPRPQAKSGSVIERIRGAFENGMALDVELVATDKSPYLNLILFSEEGHEAGTFDPVHTLMQAPYMRVGDAVYQVGFGTTDEEAESTADTETTTGNGSTADEADTYKESHIYVCKACGHQSFRGLFPEARDISSRVHPGDLYTDKECPRCGSLSVPQKKEASGV